MSVPRPAEPAFPSPDARLVWVEKIARLMDSSFTLPGTNFRFGLDPILGLLPVAGDAAGLAVSGALVLTMIRHGASRKVIILMVLNVLLDATIGAIPIIGWLFDFTYKANDRNVRLLKKHYHEGKYEGSGTGIIILVVLFFLLLMAGVIYGGVKLAGWVWDYVQQAF